MEEERKSLKTHSIKKSEPKLEVEKRRRRRWRNKNKGRKRRRRCVHARVWWCNREEEGLMKVTEVGKIVLSKKAQTILRRIVPAKCVKPRWAYERREVKFLKFF